MTKEELRGDAFITTSDHVLAFIDRHAKIFAAVFAIAAIAGVVYVAKGYIDARREHGANESIYQAEAELRKARGNEEGIAKYIPSAVSADDYQKKFASPVAKLEAEIQKHSNTKASLVSALNLSYFLVQQKQFAEALKVLESTKYQPSASDLLSGFWNMHRGLIYLENKDPKRALEAYDAVVKSSSLKLFHPEALLKMGYCQELSGDKEKAREFYERVGREFPRSEAAQSAEQYLRVMQLTSAKQG
jgi:TolA-binding protein